ncbi:hypothetical protein TSMEX_009934 [Taenia solium]|eukprot:TsM_000301300 transcript=TsM_000301300 gene=TsM_000301300
MKIDSILLDHFQSIFGLWIAYFQYAGHFVSLHSYIGRFLNSPPGAPEVWMFLGCLKRRCIGDKFYLNVMHRYRSQRRALCCPRRPVSLTDQIGISVDPVSTSQSEGTLYVTCSTGLSTTGPYLPGISLQHRTTPREWYCINDFADALSRTILRDLYVPPPTADFESTARKLLRINHNRQQLIAPRLTLVGHSALGHSSIASLLEATASHLEQVIMREVFSSALLLRPKSPPLPLPSHPFPQYTLVRFAQDVASQACQSAKWRMRAIQRVADSMLCSLTIVTSSDFHSTMMEAINVDHSPCFGCFASRLTSQCLSEALRSEQKRLSVT